MPHDAPPILIIETSGQVGRLGLVRGPDLLAEAALDESRRHARDLAPAAANLVREAGLHMRDLAAVFVSLGPGSYTGLRVGVVSAKTLAYATGCALVGVPTFHALAWQSRTLGAELDVIADAQKQKLYVQRFKWSPDGAAIEPAEQLKIVTTREWQSQRQPEVAVVGPGLKLIAELLPAETPTAALDQCEAAVSGILAVGWANYIRGQRDDCLGLEPIYLRPSSAEEQWGRRP